MNPKHVVFFVCLFGIALSVFLISSTTQCNSLKNAPVAPQALVEGEKPASTPTKTPTNTTYGGIEYDFSPEAANKLKINKQ